MKISYVKTFLLKIQRLSIGLRTAKREKTLMLSNGPAKRQRDAPQTGCKHKHSQSGVLMCRQSELGYLNQTEIGLWSHI
jgi:hypothetical protein